MLNSNWGWLSLLPPLVAMILVLITREILFSLLAGIFAGALIFTNFNFYSSISTTFKVIIYGIVGDPKKNSDTIGDKIYIVLFLGLLGALVIILTMAGGAKAYGNWACKKIKTRTKTQLTTCFLGVLFCIDDYFHFLASSVIMKPVAEKNKISSHKLAYLLDATAAPICVIAPISSWGAAICSILEESHIKNSMGTFIKTIPYNLYSIITIIMLIALAYSKFEFGPMAKFEKEAYINKSTHHSSNENGKIEGLEISQNGKIIYMVLPIITLIVVTLACILKTGGYFNNNITLLNAFKDTKIGESLTIGAFAALGMAFCLFVPFKVINFKNFMDGIVAGIKTMTTPFLILILAWAISDICSESFLNTGAFIKAILKGTISPALFPFIMFIFACFLSFATGTSWGTFGIFIPIVVSACNGLPQNIFIISLSAVLAGSVFGDHISPISDTTVLASTGAGCSHIEHVYTQIPYACLAAGISGLGYLVAGFIQNVIVVWSTSLTALGLAIIIIKLILKKKNKLFISE